MKEKKLVIIDSVGVKAGLDHYNDSLAKHLKDLGVNSRVYSNYSSEFSEKKFPFSFSKSAFNIIRLIRSYKRILNDLKQEQPEFVLVHLFKGTKFSEWFIKRIKSLHIKLILIVHDIESLISDTGNDKEMGALIKLGNIIVVHNQFSKTEFLKKFTEEEKRLIVIPHGDYLSLPSSVSKKEAMSILGLKNDLPIVLFFGMIKPSKGLETLLSAMLNVKARLVVAGRLRNTSKQDYMNLFKSLESEGRLYTDINYVSNEKRDLYFKAADVIVLPYKKIYQSGVLLMAMSYGIPVIASDLKANREFTENIKAVELFSVGDSVDLSLKLTQLLSEESERSSLIKNGLMILKTNHDWKLIANKFNTLLAG